MLQSMPSLRIRHDFVTTITFSLLGYLLPKATPTFSVLSCDEGNFCCPVCLGQVWVPTLPSAPFRLAACYQRKRQWHPTPVLLPGKSLGRRSLEGSDTTERLHFHFSLSLSTFMHGRRKWQPTPVFLPGECQGRGRLVGCHLWGRTQSDTTEAT